MDFGLLLSATASNGLFGTLKGGAETLYRDVLGIATPIAIASVAIALLVSMLSHNQKAVDASKQVIKWVVIAFIALFLLTTIFSWVSSAFNLSVPQG